MSNEVVLRFLADTKQLEAAYSRVAGKTTALNRTLASIGGFGTMATKSGRSLTHGLTVPVLALGGAATAMGYKWDQTWTKIRSLTNMTTADIEKARQKTLSLSSTGMSPQKLAEGFYFLASAGLTSAKAMDALEYAAKGASVGLGDFEALSQTVSTAMIVWQKEGITAAQVTDTMIAAVKAGKMEPDKFATNLGKVAGQAAAVGVSLRETAGAMARMTNTGMSAESSAVSLGQVLKNIARPSKQAQKAAQEIGLSYDHLRETLKTKGLIAALEEMQKATGGNREKMLTLFNGNVQATRGYDSLMGNIQATKGTMQEMSKDTGALGRAMKETAESPAHKLQVAFAGIKKIGIEWGAVLLPKVAELAAKISGLAERFSKLTPEQRQMAVKFAAIAAAIGPVLYVVGKLASGFALLGGGWKRVGFALLIGYLIKLYATNNDVRNAVNEVGAAFGKLIVWAAKNKDIVYGLVAAYATYKGLMIAVTAVQKIHNAVQVTSRAITVGLSAVTRGAASAMAVYRMAVAVAAMEGKGFVVAQGLMAVAQWALNAAFMACPITWVVAAIAVLAGAFVYAWKHSETFRNKVKDAWVQIQQVTGSVIHAIMPLIKGMVWWILTQFQIVIEGAALLFGWIPGIGPKLKKAADAFGDFKSDVMNKLQDIGDDAATWGREVGYGYAHGLRTSSPGLIAAAAQQSKAVKDAYADPDKYFREAGRQNVDAYAKGMRDKAQQARAEAARIASQTAVAAKQRSDTLMLDVGKQTSAKYGYGIRTGVAAAKNAGGVLVLSAYNGAKFGTPSWSGLGEDAASGYTQGIYSGTNSAVLAARAMAKQAMAAIQKAQNSNSPSKVAMALGKDAGSGYSMGISASSAGVTNAASALVVSLVNKLKAAKARVVSETKDVYDALHPGKGRKVNATNVRHQREQLARAKANAAAIAKQLAAARAEDARVRAQRIKYMPELGRAEQMLKPWSDIAKASEGPVSKAANALAASIQKHFQDKSGKLPAAVAALKANLLQMAKDAAELHQNVFDTLVGGASLTSAFSGQDASAADMKLFLANKVRDMQEFGTDLTLLAQRGLPTSLLKQFALAGTDALPMLRSLLGSSNTDFASIVENQRRVDQLANTTASTVESAVYGSKAAGTALSIGSVSIALNVPVGADGKALASDILAELKALGGA